MPVLQLFQFYLKLLIAGMMLTATRSMMLTKAILLMIINNNGESDAIWIAAFIVADQQMQYTTLCGHEQQSLMMGMHE
jgi:hypothetical protein